MLYEYDNYVFDTRLKFKKAKNLINLLMGLSVLASIVYLVYWVFIVSDKIVFEYTVNYFSPLANFLFPNGSGFDIYINTSYALFAFVLPLFLLSVILDKTEDKLLKEHEKLLEIKKKKLMVQKKVNHQRQYDDIKQYSICLSADYKPDIIDKEIKNKLNHKVFSYFEKHLLKSGYKTNIYLKDVFIITSQDFDGYDEVYDTLIKYLAKIKKFINEKYSLILIPTITVDAFSNNIDIETIEKNHFDIENCNFQNRACSTSMFQKKYKHINKNKYAGVPIGEYALFENDNTKTYELNMICKNLTSALAKL